MFLAGAIEFGPAEIALLLVGLVAIFVVPPTVGGWVGLRIYRKRVALEDQTRGRALLWGAMGAVAGFGLMLLIGAISELV